MIGNPSEDSFDQKPSTNPEASDSIDHNEDGIFCDVGHPAIVQEEKHLYDDSGHVEDEGRVKAEN